MGKANEQAKDKPSLLNRWLNGIEKVGNKLPHPISIFAILVLFVIVLSAVCEMAGVSATGELVNRSKGVVETQTVQAVSLLNGEGLVYMLTHAITNFTGFAPLGVVLVAMFGIGLLEDSGLIGGALKSAVEVTPAKLITPILGRYVQPGRCSWIHRSDSDRSTDVHGIQSSSGSWYGCSICRCIRWFLCKLINRYSGSASLRYYQRGCKDGRPDLCS